MFAVFFVFSGGFCFFLMLLLLCWLLVASLLAFGFCGFWLPLLLRLSCWSLQSCAAHSGHALWPAYRAVLQVARVAHALCCWEWPAHSAVHSCTSCAAIPFLVNQFYMGYCSIFLPSFRPSLIHSFIQGGIYPWDIFCVEKEFGKGKKQWQTTKTQ